MKVTIDYKELKKFLAYLEDKTDDVYIDEVNKSIRNFLEEVSNYEA